MTLLRWRLTRSAALPLALLCVAAAPAGAEVLVSGGADTIVLRATNATMAEVLSGIHSALNISIEATGAPARQFTGTYSGPLRRVLSRLLDGENYIISFGGGGLDIVFVGSRPGGGPPLRWAAADQGEGNAVQGWTGTGAFSAAAAPAKPAGSPADAAAAPQPKVTAENDEAVNPVQGWVAASPFRIASASGVPATDKPAAQTAAGGGEGAAPGQATSAAVDDIEPANPVQGWAAAGNPFKVAAPSVASHVADDQAAATVGEDGGDPNLQGFGGSGAWQTRAPAAPGATDTQ